MDHTTVEHLLMDEGFFAWYHRTDENEIDRWDQWIAASQENRLLAEEAIRWLTVLHSLEDTRDVGTFLQEDRAALICKISQ